jgi:acyl-CoA thioester hydrolase
MTAITIPIHVRYVECDPMGVVHHSVYPVWLEIARTELLRASGISYAELERTGVFIVVVKLSLSYRRPARYDDQLQVTARLSAAKIEHEYEVKRGDELLCTASTVLACIDRDGRPQRVPDFIHL